jgi:hypothetical protein
VIGIARALTRRIDGAILWPTCLAALTAVLWSAPAAAQSAGRIEVGGGARWIGSTSFGQLEAEETSFGGGTRPLFKTSTDLDRSTGVEARVSVNLTRLVQAEGVIALNRIDLTTRVTADVEGVVDTTAAEPVTQYAFEGGVLLQLARWSGGKLLPFAAGGAAYLRQVHDRRTLVDSGHSFYVGGGVKYLLTSGGTGRIKATGLRGDVRAVFTSGNIAPDDKARTAPSVSASFFVAF